LKARGYNLDTLSDRVGEIFDVTPEEIFFPGKYKERVQARSVFSYWAVRFVSWERRLHALQGKSASPNPL